ncbi:MAG: hypothetical protein ACT4OJ_11940 [Bacteroidota bacterium]
MKRHISTLFMVISFSAGAQKIKLNDGFLITKAGDTLKGLVYWKKNSRSSDSLLYKKTEGDAVKHYAWGELKYAWNENAKQAITICSVKRSLEYIDQSNFNIQLPDSTVTEAIPLTPLYTGNRLSLYRFYDKSNYFFIYDGKEMLQLVQKYRYLTEFEKRFDFQRAPKYYVLNEYRGLLSVYYDFREDKKLKYLLENSLYEEKSLYTLISKLDKKLK